jgi:hypothetical protein
VTPPHPPHSSRRNLARPSGISCAHQVPNLPAWELERDLIIKADMPRAHLAISSVDAFTRLNHQLSGKSRFPRTPEKEQQRGGECCALLLGTKFVTVGHRGGECTAVVLEDRRITRSSHLPTASNNFIAIRCLFTPFTLKPSSPRDEDKEPRREGG